MKLSAEVRASIRAELARRGQSQKDLAENLGLSQVAVSRRLAGQTPIDIDELGAIAEFLGLPVSALLPQQVGA